MEATPLIYTHTFKRTTLGFHHAELIVALDDACDSTRHAAARFRRIPEAGLCSALHAHSESSTGEAILTAIAQVGKFPTDATRIVFYLFNITFSA